MHPPELPSATSSSPTAGAGPWSRFEADLSIALQSLDRGYLVLDVKGTSRYLQFRSTRKYGVHAEVVGNACLPEPERLGEAQLAALAALGWSGPTAPADTDATGKDGIPNHFRDFPPPVPYAEIARLAVRILSEVLGVPGPDALAYGAFDVLRNRLQLPALHLEERPVVKPDGEESRPAPTAPPEDDGFARLRRSVIEELREGTGNPALELDQGDTADVQLGEVQVFVWARPRPLSVRVWCGVAKPIDVTPGVHALMNAVNNELAFARIYSYRDAIFLTVDVPAEPFRAEHLRQAIIGLASLAPELRQRFHRHPSSTGEA
jgi:hypothetical protein